MKLSKRQKEAESRRRADLSAQGAGRTDIDYETDELPSTHILAHESVKLRDKPKSAEEWFYSKWPFDDRPSFSRIIEMLDEYLNEMNE